MSSQKGFAHILILVIILAGIGLGVYLISQRTNLIPKASVSNPVTAETSFTLQTSNSSVANNQQFTVDVIARSDFNSANLFSANLNFPTNSLEVVSVAKSTNLTQWVEEFYDNTTGEVRLTGGLPDPGYKTTVGVPGLEIASITFRAKALGSASITFDPSSAIYENSSNSDILVFKRDLTINVGTVASATPVSTPTASPDPTPIPTIVPTATPVPTKTGDGNGDGRVNLVDMSVLLSKFSKNDSSQIDMNADGLINTFDFSLLKNKLISLGVIRVRTSQ